MDHFQLVSDYKPAGDQEKAIEGLVNGVNWACGSKRFCAVVLNRNF